MESSLNIHYLLLLRAVSVAVLPRPVDGCEAGELELQDAWQQCQCWPRSVARSVVRLIITVTTAAVPRSHSHHHHHEGIKTQCKPVH